MNPNGSNTILITGGGSGIGRALAEAFYKRGNTVVIAGRRKDALDEVQSANPGMFTQVVDVQDPAQVQSLAKDVTAKFPALNVLINMAGIMKPEKLNDASDPSVIDSTIATNLAAPIHLTTALLPHLKAQPKATVITVSSGLAFTPMAMTPTYCATKAAIHAWSVCLRYQLKETGVEVLELVPPWVQTDLLGKELANDSRAMPLAAFIEETMDLLARPDAKEILVKRVYPLRFAGDFNAEKFYGFFEQFNAAMAIH